MTRKFLCAALLVSAAIVAPAQTNATRSLITVHVEKAGLFSAFAHNHTVMAPVEHAAIDAGKRSTEIVVLAKQMKVTDPEESESNRAEIQSTMLGPKVLDAAKYPEIRFQSARIERVGENYRVTGTLNLHGMAKEISFDVSNAADHYHGKAKFNQTEFGIKPISLAAGTIKVKDKLEIEFDIYPAEFKNAARR
jgi:polyisoprenoid-binding protein YceI